jgi:methylglutaconyl-CoA hydratase
VALVETDLQGPVATVALNDPDRRNALSTSMFLALESALLAVAAHHRTSVLRLRGHGPAFCAGFDLAACVADPTLLSEFVRRLGGVLRTLRRMRHVVVAEVQGAALAGGCAIVSACDLVVVAPDASLGYPVHRIGVSPAVTLPTLRSATGGHARSIVLGGELLDGRAALRAGLAARMSERSETLADEAALLCASLAAKGPAALAATKHWLNELDGSLDDARFERTAEASAGLCDGEECRTLLASFWARRAQR